MLIDTHCHLNDEALFPYIDNIIMEAKSKGVAKYIVVGWNKESSIKAIEIAHNYPDCYASIGVHPSNIREESDLEWMKDLAKDDKVIAIGEIGLDYYWDKDNKDDQKEWFRKQVIIAKEINKPVIIHTRDAIEETYNLLEEVGYYNGVIHCFSGSKEMAKKFIKLGFYLGIGGVLTFKNTNLIDTLKEIGIEKVISETDSPYLAPVPYRGQTNYPKYIYEIVCKMVDVTGKDFNEIENSIEKNVKDLFNI